MSVRPHIFDSTPQELVELLTSWQMPRFRARQVLDWVYRRGVIDPQAMTNLSKADRTTLGQNLTFTRGEVSQHQLASDGTEKVLLDWDVLNARSLEPIQAMPTLPIAQSPSGQVEARPHQTECVMIPATSRDSGKARRTACISSQVGCPVGCHFCASGLGGLDANLTAGQIVEQAWRLDHLPTDGQTRAHANTPGQGLTNIVFMGMGEPLANFKPVTRAIGFLTADWGLNLSPRRITLSTVGLPAPIRRLADLDLGVTLALSLHAPNDPLRREIIPWADFVTIEQLLEAGRYYFEKTGREITLEYILLGGVNDQPEHAHELARIARRLRSNVNLIRYNEVADLPYARPTDHDVRQFQDVLRESGLTTHVRASRGRDIAAACGQLRHETKAGAS